jgi:hypothetical protein
MNDCKIEKLKSLFILIVLILDLQVIMFLISNYIFDIIPHAQDFLLIFAFYIWILNMYRIKRAVILVIVMINMIIILFVIMEEHVMPILEFIFYMFEDLSISIREAQFLMNPIKYCRETEKTYKEYFSIVEEKISDIYEIVEIIKFL